MTDRIHVLENLLLIRFNNYKDLLIKIRKFGLIKYKCEKDLLIKVRKMWGIFQTGVFSQEPSTLLHDKTEEC